MIAQACIASAIKRVCLPRLLMGAMLKCVMVCEFLTVERRIWREWGKNIVLWKRRRRRKIIPLITYSRLKNTCGPSARGSWGLASRGKNKSSVSYLTTGELAHMVLISCTLQKAVSLASHNCLNYQVRHWLRTRYFLYHLNCRRSHSSSGVLLIWTWFGFRCLCI